MARGTVMPAPEFNERKADGSPLAGGLLSAYKAGTLTPLNTYSDVNLTIANQNPVILDGNGRAKVYLSEASYDFWLTDSLGNAIWGPVTVSSTALGQASGVGEIFSLGGSRAFVVTDLAYPVGATVDKLHQDSAIWNVDSANLPGTYALEVMLISADGIVTVTAALVNLDDGAPDVPMVTCASVSAVGERKQSAAIVFPAGGIAKNYGLKVKVSGAAGGYAYQARIVRTA